MSMQSNRAIVRIRGLPGHPPTPREGDIYYIRTETPHLYDFSVFGPFHIREAMVPSIMLKLQQESPGSLTVFEETLDEMGGMDAFEHIIAPLSGGNTLTIRVVTEHNPAVAAILPGPTWAVIDAELQSIRPMPDSGAVSLKDMTVFKTYTSADEGIQGVRELVSEKLRIRPGARKIEQSKPDGTITCVVMSTDKQWMIEARYDSGEYF